MGRAQGFLYELQELLMKYDCGIETTRNQSIAINFVVDFSKDDNPGFVDLDTFYLDQDTSLP